MYGQVSLAVQAHVRACCSPLQLSLATYNTVNKILLSNREMPSGLAPVRHANSPD